MFRPYIGLNLIDGGDYSVTLMDDGSYLGSVSVQRSSGVAIMTGATTELSIHLGKSSDLMIGIRLNMAWRNMGYRANSTDSSQTYDAWEDMEFIRLAPTIGYRFHL